jgi:tRNA (guanine-N7-)-methyltransferase
MNNAQQSNQHYSFLITHSSLLSLQTYYESMWIARGLNIRYMKWHLPHTGELTEPDVEIELDEYRSYHRNKRSPKDKAK